MKKSDVERNFILVQRVQDDKSDKENENKENEISTSLSEPYLLVTRKCSKAQRDNSEDDDFSYADNKLKSIDEQNERYPQKWNLDNLYLFSFCLFIIILIFLKTIVF